MQDHSVTRQYRPRNTQQIANCNLSNQYLLTADSRDNHPPSQGEDRDKFQGRIHLFNFDNGINSELDQKIKGDRRYQQVNVLKNCCLHRVDKDEHIYPLARAIYKAKAGNQPYVLSQVESAVLFRIDINYYPQQKIGKAANKEYECQPNPLRR